MVEQDYIGKKCFGMYLGTVIQHMTHGQLKVHIQGVYPDDWKSNPALLPICHQVTPQFAGSHDGNGVFSYPNIGSTVVCMFANGDQNLPFTIGSVLGGMNAFGQYEYIKDNTELCSTKHLVTAGMSHLEMHESGKISAIVVNPIRTEAIVDYGSNVDSPLSIDAVTSRPVCEQVQNAELSNIDCQYVLDNDLGHGTISSSTHWYDPESYQSVTSSDGKICTKKGSNDSQVDSYSVVDNDGHREEGHIQSKKNSGMCITVNAADQAITSEVVSLTSDATTAFKHNLDGTNLFSTLSDMTDVYNYSSYGSSSTVVSAHNTNAHADSSHGCNIDTSFWMSGALDIDTVNSMQNSSTGQNKTQKLKSSTKSAVVANGKSSIQSSTLSTSNLVETDTEKGITMHTNKHDASTNMLQSSENGIVVQSKWNDDDVMQMSGTNVNEKHTNSMDVDVKCGEDPSFRAKLHKKYTKSINGSEVKYDVECEAAASPTDGENRMYIKDIIEDNSADFTMMSSGDVELKSVCKGGSIQVSIGLSEGANMCTFIMDSSGNMVIKSIASLVIDSPNVVINGSTVNIRGSSGDCMIKNVSLLNHAHVQTQMGKTLTATRSN